MMYQVEVVPGNGQRLGHRMGIRTTTDHLGLRIYTELVTPMGQFQIEDRFISWPSIYRSAEVMEQIYQSMWNQKS